MLADEHSWCGESCCSEARDEKVPGVEMKVKPLGKYSELKRCPFCRSVVELMSG